MAVPRLSWRIRALALTTLLAAQAACSSGGGGGAVVPVDMRGIWTGTWRSTSNPAFQGTISFNLSQQAITVIGSGSLSGSPCISISSVGVVDARVDDAQRLISGSVVFSAGTLSFNANIAGNSQRISGTYFFSGAGGCNGDQGNVSAQKATPFQEEHAPHVLLRETLDVQDDAIVITRQHYPAAGR